jgi:uncharacterized oxidoreductase
MDLAHAQVLITGGSDGIGLGMAKRFLHAGSRVMITGRNAEKLEKAVLLYPRLATYVNDIGRPEQREALANHVTQTMLGLNILINNAGIQRRVALAVDDATWSERQNEIDILFSAPVHLNHLLLPLMLGGGEPTLIVNVTSGGAYIPQAFAPVYSACKAALHSYTVTLRHALKDTLCRVVELIPPAVKTSLAGVGLQHGVLLDDFCDAVFPKLFEDGIIDIGFGPTEKLVPELNGQSISQLFEASAKRFKVKVYEKK